jgi:hypothetical protein
VSEGVSFVVCTRSKEKKEEAEEEENLSDEKEDLKEATAATFTVKTYCRHSFFDEEGGTKRRKREGGEGGEICRGPTFSTPPFSGTNISAASSSGFGRLNNLWGRRRKKKVD